MQWCGYVNGREHYQYFGGASWCKLLMLFRRSMSMIFWWVSWFVLMLVFIKCFSFSNKVLIWIIWKFWTQLIMEQWWWCELKLFLRKLLILTTISAWPRYWTKQLMVVEASLALLYNNPTCVGIVVNGGMRYPDTPSQEITLLMKRTRCVFRSINAMEILQLVAPMGNLMTRQRINLNMNIRGISGRLVEVTYS